MQNAAKQARQTWLEAVCYKCSYRGRGDVSCCPDCSFPLIFEPENTPEGGTRVEDIFARSSITVGAPPLPGVDAGLRKAALLAQARQRRLTERRAATARDEAVRKESRLERVRIALICVSAIATGILGAVVHHSL